MLFEAMLFLSSFAENDTGFCRRQQMNATEKKQQKVEGSDKWNRDFMTW
jgi:hypothetical protein